MKKILIFPLILLGITLTACSTNDDVKHDKSIEKTIEKRDQSTQTHDNKKENKTDDKSKEKTDDVKTDNTNIDDTFVNGLKDKLEKSGYMLQTEKTKTDENWKSIIKYTKDYDDAIRIVFIQKTMNKDKMKNIEKFSEYNNSNIIKSKNNNVVILNNVTPRFVITTAYDKLTGYGIVIKTNGSPKSDTVKNASKYSYELLSDIIAK